LAPDVLEPISFVVELGDDRPNPGNSEWELVIDLTPYQAHSLSFSTD